MTDWEWMVGGMGRIQGTFQPLGMTEQWRDEWGNNKLTQSLWSTKEWWDNWWVAEIVCGPFACHPLWTDLNANNWESNIWTLPVRNVPIWRQLNSREKKFRNLVWIGDNRIWNRGIRLWKWFKAPFLSLFLIPNNNHSSTVGVGFSALPSSFQGSTLWRTVCLSGRWQSKDEEFYVWCFRI